MGTTPHGVVTRRRLACPAQPAAPPICQPSAVPLCWPPASPACLHARLTRPPPRPAPACPSADQPHASQRGDAGGHCRDCVQVDRHPGLLPQGQVRRWRCAAGGRRTPRLAGRARSWLAGARASGWPVAPLPCGASRRAHSGTADADYVPACLHFDMPTHPAAAASPAAASARSCCTWPTSFTGG